MYLVSFEVQLILKKCLHFQTSREDFLTSLQSVLLSFQSVPGELLGHLMGGLITTNLSGGKMPLQKAVFTFP